MHTWFVTEFVFCPLQASFNEVTGQWVVGGMGDLHLEVAVARLRREHKLDVSMGPLLTAFKEMPVKTAADSCSEVTSTFIGQVGRRQQTILVDLVLQVDPIFQKTQVCFILF